ncbi:MAG: Adaptive-response sensory-kinase SasA [Steroidobacteraceae bacterium]|nr:Adaptive-response sensory-kinase SasA [Steroidobacteraceae bacterium]
MVPAGVRRFGSAALVALWVAIGAALLILLAKTAQNSAQFGRLQPWILLLNIAGVIALTVLLVRRIARLARDYRNHVPGSRLTVRSVTTFGALVIAPLVIVYLFSLDFLNRGIDSWFRVEVKQGLSEALVLSRAALDRHLREHASRVEEFAQALAEMPDAELAAAIDAERRASGATEVVLFGANSQLIAASSGALLSGAPARPTDEVLRQVGQGRPYVALEPRADGQYDIRIAAPLGAASVRRDPRFVMVVYEVPSQLAALSEAVQRSYSQYGELAAMRDPLKYSFRLTLTLVLLVAMLAAINGAIVSSRRFARPVQDLIAGTRAVGKGDFGARLPLPSRDELGFLVQSFNDMTRRLRRAREEANRSQAEVEHERERLAVILARLSTGVLSVDRSFTVRLANAAASSILGVDLAAESGRPLEELVGGNPRVAQFVQELRSRTEAGRGEWREQIELPGEAGRRVLMCACTPLPGADDEAGYVLVFDDITALLVAQREAAWGEVARRLAHEIKNPLTPIQLSAERMRRRFLSRMSASDAAVLERATHTIVQQVEAMKQMVNAFSEYARTPDMTLARFALNPLVTEVADLYRAQNAGVALRLALDTGVESLVADRGRVRQILNNLLANAFEALEGQSGGRIEVATRLEAAGTGPAVQITVSDNGPGFRSDIIERAFDPYVTSKTKGTGLGLAIVRRIADEHGGHVEVENLAGGGARVTVTLPLDDAARAAAGRERRNEKRRERA